MNDSYQLVWLILAFPLLGFLIQALAGGWVVRTLGPKRGKRLMGTLAVLPIVGSFIVGVTLVQYLSLSAPTARESTQTLFSWIKIASIDIPFEFRIDPLSMTMVLIITGIGALIHLYATGYMSEEKEYTRFFTYLNLFISFMLVLVLGANLPLLFIGWEGVGLCSYLLIGFWYKDFANARAANKAFIVNRIGDWGMTLGMFLIVALITTNLDKLGNVGNARFLSYDVIFNPRVLEIFKQNPGVTTAIALLLFVGAMGKSAQFPLYVWLPDAMAGPTPVSALIHAATMVTAGVVLVNRMHPIFELSPVACSIVAVIGAFTALFAALIAFGQTDIKKVLAYSTVSQLGFMFVACGVGAFWVGMFHVTTHAFFKALLFLGSGAVIHAMSHDQDMRHYGNLAKYIKGTAATMVIGWLAIAGIPPLAGYWSKEAILGGAFGNQLAVVNGVNVGQICGWVLLLVAVLTAAYMTRMTMLTFFGPKEQWREMHAHDHGHDHHAEHAHHEVHHGHDHHGQDPSFFYSDEEMAARTEAEEHHHALDGSHQPHEVPPSMLIPLIVLAVLSLVGGWVLHNNELLQHWLYPGGLTFLDAEAVAGEPHGWMGQPVPVVGNVLGLMGTLAGVIGILYGLAVYRRGLPERENEESKWHPFRRSARDQFGYDQALVEGGVEGGGLLGNFMWRKVDSRFVDGTVNGIAGFFGGLGTMFRSVQSGYVRDYAILMMVGVAGVLGTVAYVISKIGGAQ